MLRKALRGQSPKSSMDFRVKLLTGKKTRLILIEAKDYAGELFIPRIVNGRICLLNVLHARRSERTVHPAKTPESGIYSNAMDTAGGGISQSGLSRLSAGATNFRGSWRMSTGNGPPIANSTPILQATSKDGEAVDGKAIPTHSVDSGAPSSPATPEPPRFLSCNTVMGAALNTPNHRLHAQDDRLAQFEMPYSKVQRLYRHQTPGTPKNIGRLVMPTAIGGQSSTSSPIVTPPRVVFFNPTHRDTSTLSPMRSPNVQLSKIRENTVARTGRFSSSGAVVKWRKCITPLRTYSRRALHKHLPSVASIAKTLCTPRKLKPNYLANPTRGVRPNFDITMKRRRLIIDPKMMISPGSFKQQQLNANQNTIATTRPAMLLPQNRKAYERSRMAAFDLLTNTHRGPIIAQKLQDLFRRSCINKTSTTHPKYKLVSAIPPLENARDPTRFYELSRQPLRERITNANLMEAVTNPAPARVASKGI